MDLNGKRPLHRFFSRMCNFSLITFIAEIILKDFTKILFIIDDTSELYGDPVEGPAGYRGRAIKAITARWGKAP